MRDTFAEVFARQLDQLASSPAIPRNDGAAAVDGGGRHAAGHEGRVGVGGHCHPEGVGRSGREVTSIGTPTGQPPRQLAGER